MRWLIIYNNHTKLADYASPLSVLLLFLILVCITHLSLFVYYNDLLFHTIQCLLLEKKIFWGGKKIMKERSKRICIGIILKHIIWRFSMVHQTLFLG